MPANAFVVRQVTSAGAFKAMVEVRALGDNYGRFSSIFAPMYVVRPFFMLGLHINLLLLLRFCLNLRVRKHIIYFVPNCFYWGKVLTLFLEVLAPNPSKGTGFPDLRSCLFSSVLHKCRDSRSVTPWPLPSKSFRIHRSSTTKKE
jgi:hypothetical protein